MPSPSRSRRGASTDLAAAISQSVGAQSSKSLSERGQLLSRHSDSSLHFIDELGSDGDGDGDGDGSSGGSGDSGGGSGGGSAAAAVPAASPAPSAEALERRGRLRAQVENHSQHPMS